MTRIDRIRPAAPWLLGATMLLAAACSSSSNNAGSTATTAPSAGVAQSATASGTLTAAATAARQSAATPSNAGSPAPTSATAAAGGKVTAPKGVQDADAALAAAAGSGSAIDQVAITKPVEIQFWHTLVGPLNDKLTSLIKDFQAKNPLITVSAQYVGNYDALYQKIQTSIAGGQTPDVAAAYENQVVDYQSANVLIPLDDYVKSQKYGLAKDDYADLLQAYRYDNLFPQLGNKLFSFPFTKSVELLYYNADKLKDSGLTVPQTWDDFRGDAKALTKGDTKGYAVGIDTSLFNQMVYSRGGQLISDDGKKWLYNSQAGVDSLQLFQNMVKDGSAYQVTKQFADQTDFGAGRAAFAFSSSAGLPFYQKEVSDNAKFNWNVALPPHGAGQDPVTIMYGANVAMFKSTAEKQLASWLFIKYFTSKEINPDWSTATGYLPIRSSGLSDARVQAKIAALPQYAVAVQVQQYGRPEPSVKSAQAARNHVADAITAALGDPNASAKKLLDDAVNQSNDDAAK